MVGDLLTEDRFGDYLLMSSSLSRSSDSSYPGNEIPGGRKSAPFFVLLLLRFTVF